MYERNFEIILDNIDENKRKIERLRKLDFKVEETERGLEVYRDERTIELDCNDKRYIKNLLFLKDIYGELILTGRLQGKSSWRTLGFKERLYPTNSRYTTIDKEIENVRQTVKKASHEEELPMRF